MEKETQANDKQKRTQVLFAVPNILDYTRVLILIIATTIFRLYPRLAFWFFIYVCTADGLDGWLARKLSQASVLGATLDMVIDRCFDTLMCIILAVIYPNYSILFMLLVFVDIFSHWMRHSYYSRKHHSHKLVDKGTSLLLRQYYHSRVFLSCLCIAYETLLIALFARKLIDSALIQRLSRFAISVSCPLAMVKVYINILQGIDAIFRLASE